MELTGGVPNRRFTESAKRESIRLITTKNPDCVSTTRSLVVGEWKTTSGVSKISPVSSPKNGAAGEAWSSEKLNFQDLPAGQNGIKEKAQVCQE